MIHCRYVAPLQQIKEKILGRLPVLRPGGAMSITDGNTIGYQLMDLTHIDTNKELNYPDDPHDVGPVRMKHYFDINNVDVPKTVLTSDHIYYSPNVRDRGISIEYTINPELYGASESLYGIEDQSEYHRRNINNYPDKKKFMENWTVLAARRHQEFENYVLAKSHHKLDFSDLDLSNVKTITSIDLDKETKNDLSSQLKSLNELYESGALTKEEFIKAKNILLN